ncbi:hypothetical protein ACBJ59_23795 [Nonomuraea sp. MTCD27]|uniref:hypothetical protein n=1 Tax=Nonomuraea sp. MTCD27 TaxID=1676747 RepID=UPI0035C218BA
MSGTDRRIGDTAVIPLRIGGFGACRIVGMDGDHLIVGVLDWHSETVPSLEDVAVAGTLILDHHSHAAEPAVISIDRTETPPSDLRWIGTLDGIEPVANCPRSGGWVYVLIQANLQWHWDLSLPEAAKAAYKAAAVIPSTRVELDFGHGRKTFRLGTSHLDFPKLAAVPPDATPDWSQLDALPMLTGLTWEGTDRGLIEAIGRRPVISALRWQNAPPLVDLSPTRVTSLWLSGSSPRRLLLPDRFERLTFVELSGEPPEVVAEADGARVGLFIISPDPSIPPGLRSVRNLQLSVRGSFSVASLSGLDDLEVLRIDWTTSPGELAEARQLSRFLSLFSLELNSAYALDASSLPETWPALRSLHVDGIRRETAKLLKSRYRRSELDLVVQGAKSDDWLAENLNNPFRDWIEDDRRAAAAACKAYTTASRALGDLPGDPGERAEAAKSALRAFIETLNLVDERHDGFIDTIRREESGEAFADLAERAGISTTQADEWFDDWRDF